MSVIRVGNRIVNYGGNLLYGTWTPPIPPKLDTVIWDYGYAVINGTYFQHTNSPWSGELSSLKFYDYVQGSITDIKIIGGLGLTSCESMFAYCSSLKTIDIMEMETENSTNFNDMFYECSSLKSIDLSNLKTSNATTMIGMFYECSSVEEMFLDRSNFDTSNVTDMSYMFEGLKLGNYFDVSFFKVEKVIATVQMFCHCSNIKTINCSTWNLSSIQNMDGMFFNCPSLLYVIVDGCNQDTINKFLNYFQSHTSQVWQYGTNWLIDGTVHSAIVRRR